MKHVKLFGACLVAVLAVAGIGANTALATSKPKPPKPSLVLLYEGAPAPAGETAYAGLLIDGCVLLTEGTLTSNQKKSDATAFSTPFFSECEEGYAITGKVSSAKLTETGVMSVKAAITLTVPGPCNYKISKYSVTFNPKGTESTIGEGELIAKRKSGKEKSCAADLTGVSFTAVLLNHEQGLYGTETT
ncbi:MAG TPA: hypothetical protein VK778_07525 [Solirubrobacteraceae bacterium]|nr:hypothetical protein [Solirubrobacteraceae bacterium]